MYAGRRVLLIGYGVLGSELLVDLEAAGAVVATILDDRHREIDEEPRLRGPVSMLEEVLDGGGVDLLVIGASLITASRINWVTHHARNRNLPVYVAPERSEIDSMENLSEATRVPEIEDLFARSSLVVDRDRISEVVAGRRVLVTGAGGSIGRRTVHQLVRHGAASVGLLDRDDCLLHDVAVELTGSMFHERFPLLHVDVQHRGQVLRAFEGFRPDVVVHAAALKHVATLEADPANAVAVNVLGTAHVLEAAGEVDVDLLVNVSTDKAASRVGSLGVSKYVGERMTVGEGRPGFRSVRFGNVLGSRGSVLHTFRLQAEHHGRVDVRGDATTRFFMTGGEAASLVLSTLTQEDPDGTFVFRMGDPVQILRLAQAVLDDMASGGAIHLTDLEAGEAHHEQLFGDDEDPRDTSIPEVFRVGVPALSRHAVARRVGGLDAAVSMRPDEARALLATLAGWPAEGPSDR
jgi:dTDP-glucose 4,6-dehydratase